MANYAVVNSTVGGFGSSGAGMAATYKTICCAAASTAALGTNGSMLRRGKIYDILVGTSSSPADTVLEWILQRATIGATASNGANAPAAGALSSLSSGVALDPADGTVAGFIFVNSSNESGVTLTAIPNLWYVGINQRASYRWVAAPGSEFVYPAVSSGTGVQGIVLQARSAAYTGTVSGSILLSEQ